MYDRLVIGSIKDYLVNHHESLAVAESVTAGHLQAALSLADKASLFFQGGITTYNLGQKSRHLQIDPIHAEACNCVSEKIAEEMARQVNLLFSSNWGIGITGYAAPLPECKIESLFCYYAIAYRDKIVLSSRIDSEDLGVMDTQVFYVNTLLNEFQKQLNITA